MKQVILRLLCFIFLGLGSVSLFGQDQDDWGVWDNNYLAVNMSEILRLERLYADSIEAGDGSQFYARLDKYRFSVVYMGDYRSLRDEVISSIKSVFSLYGDAGQLDGLLEDEVLVLLNGERHWFPIQPQLVNDLKKEYQPGEEVLVYCLFLNQHTSDKKLYNHLLISEFR